jgi:D-lactate dehydrogenase
MKVIDELIKKGVTLIALRSAGYNHVDIEYAKKKGIKVCRVPAYSPQAVAEHTIALILCLNRKIHQAHNRVREGNFSLHGLMGFNLYQKTIGIIGTGKIGTALAHILNGFGCKLLGYDPQPSEECKKLGLEYVSLNQLLKSSDIISLHCPLNEQTRHMINDQTIALMKKGIMLINTGRGKLIDTKAAINALKSKQLGYLGIDVYEEEEPLFFEDHSEEIINDDVFCRLLTFPNVLITGHQGFFTQEAVLHIAQTTLENITNFANNTGTVYLV